MELVIITALQAEAKPILALHQGKLMHQQKSLRFYKTSFGFVLVTGMGILNASAAIGWLSARVNRHATLVNIGLAGSAAHNINQVYQIQWVQNNATNSIWHASLWVEPKYQFAPLITYTNPVDNNQLTKTGQLADMEGYALAKAIQTYFNPSRFMLFKFISDNGVENFNFNSWQTPYKLIIPELLEFIFNAHGKLKKPASEYPEDILNVISNLTHSCKITFTQQQQIKDAALFALNYYGHNYTIDNLSKIATPKNSSERNLMVKQLLKTLSHV